MKQFLVLLAVSSLAASGNSSARQAADQSKTASCPGKADRPAVLISADDYLAAAKLLDASTPALVKNAKISPNWLGHSGKFWYRRDGDSGFEYVLVDSRDGDKTSAFDTAEVSAAVQAALAALALKNPQADQSATANQPDKLPDTAQSQQSPAAIPELGDVVLSDDLKQLGAVVNGKAISCQLKPVKCVADEPPEAVPGRLNSPSGKLAAFIRDDNLFLLDTASGKERQLTTDGTPFYSYGKLPDGALMTIQVSKLNLKLPPFGAEFSPDERYLLVPRIDERELPNSSFVEWVPTDGSLRPVLHQVRNAYTGDHQKLESDLFVFDTVSGKSVKVEKLQGFEQGAMDGSVLGWSNSRQQAFVLGRSFGSQDLVLARIDLKTGKNSLLMRESAKTRVQTNTVEYNRPNIRVIGDGDEVVWYTDRTGWGHLELYDAQTGALKNSITSGDWLVQDIHHIDTENREIFFTAGGREAGRDPYYRHLYKAPLDGGEITLLTDVNADHMIAPEPVPLMALLFGIKPPPPVIRPDLGVFVDTWSTVEQAPVTELRSTDDGSLIATLETADASALYAAGWKAPSRHAVKAADGVTDIYTVYYAPLKDLPGSRHPVIDSVYGGPQVIVAPRNFTEAHNLRNPGSASALARLGFAVVITDGRGTPLRSNAFRDAGYTEFTQVGIDDHIAAIEQLAVQHPEMDTTEVGIYGWSWGGTFSAQAILSRPDFYDVAVSGAGVYDYAALYPGFESFTGIPVYGDGSNLRGSPQEKPANWEKLDITRLAGNLQGKLMLVYGDMDENVPQHQAFRLIDALIKANKPYDLLYLPNRTHSGGHESYPLQRKMDYFVEHLLHTRPPLDATIERSTQK